MGPDRDILAVPGYEWPSVRKSAGVTQHAQRCNAARRSERIPFSVILGRGGITSESGPSKLLHRKARCTRRRPPAVLAPLVYVSHRTHLPKYARKERVRCSANIREMVTDSIRIILDQRNRGHGPLDCSLDV
ncbi:hypothetical protein WOLCODRAFT_141044 [Wolfiporia cocos MD-104 SS10]|uniref:Uncharacterized protein n=1 Tax=Wolfiporia cocos (strain MD-104) TaxID=742152 RepID=A0A2H3JGL9_WOLCO|nr:hypothetical protein WOLCODRAFT_141044 [Wolfiporia cocos MD-104 SS10]